LNSISLKTDTYAESVINDVAMGDAFSDLINLFKTLADNDDVSFGNELNQTVYTYFNTNMELPDWGDQSKIKVAQDVFARFGPQVA